MCKNAAVCFAIRAYRNSTGFINYEANDLHLDFAGALSLAAVRGGDGVVGAVGDGAAEVEAEPVLEGQLVRAAPGVHLWIIWILFNILRSILKYTFYTRVKGGSMEQQVDAQV